MQGKPHAIGLSDPPYNYATHRYFETDVALTTHWRSKVHKRRCKALNEPAYTIEEAEKAAGLGREGKRETTSMAGVGQT